MNKCLIGYNLSLAGISEESAREVMTTGNQVGHRPKEAIVRVFK